jgi:hypothetical protein
MTNQLLILLLILAGVWLIVDQLFGKKHVGRFIDRLTGKAGEANG